MIPQKYKNLALVANSVVYTGTLLLSFRMPIAGFTMAIAGSFLFFIYGVKTDQRSFSWFNLLYGITNLFALTNWWGHAEF